MTTHAECIFCKIARGEAPSHTLWEDEHHLAFLSIYPNTEAFTVVIPKKHYVGYAFDAPDNVLADLVHAAKKVGKMLDTTLSDVGRTGLIFEGFGVDHLHAKLFPMHGTKGDEWKKKKALPDKYFAQYEGYISSHDYKRADDAELEELTKKIKEKKKRVFL